MRSHDNLIANIERFRIALGMTPGQLIKATGLSATGFYDIKRGNNSPRLESLEAIANALHVCVADLLIDIQTSGYDRSVFKDHVLPHGFQWVTAALPPVKAHTVRAWEREALVTLTSAKK